MRTVGVAAFAVVATACPVEPPAADHDASVRACKLEYQTLKTAYSASAADPVLTVHDFLQGPLTYYVLEAGPTTKPVQRSLASLASVSEVECQPLAVPLGSD